VITSSAIFEKEAPLAEPIMIAVKVHQVYQFSCGLSIRML
jgi:hypothetical protein